MIRGWVATEDGTLVPTRRPEEAMPPGFMGADGLDALETPQWLVEPYLGEGAMVMLAAAANTGKTFLALDWALELSSQGHRVLYMALEGLHGIKKRVAAWRQHHGKDVGDILFGRPGYRVDLLDRIAVDRLCEEVKKQGPFALVVIDNLGEAFPGDENDAKAVGQVMAGLKRVQLASGGALLDLHNFGHGGNRARGHSKLLDSHDTVIYMTEMPDSPDGRKITCGKERNAERFNPRGIQLKTVGESLVVEYGGALAAYEEVTSALLGAEQPMTITEILKVVNEGRQTPLSRDTVTRRLRKLIEMCEVSEAAKRGNAPTFVIEFAEVAR